jgi:CO/xanthine dehydrogenase Mo-binding subunit
MRYPSDIAFPNMLHVKVLRSNVPHGRLVRIDATQARRQPGVHAVLTRDDLEGTEPFGWFIKDQPMVATDKVRYVGDIIAAVAANSPAEAAAALRHIDVEIESLPAVTNVRTADEEAPLFEEAPLGIVPPYGPGASAELRPRPNVCYEFNYTTGSRDVWDTCDEVHEDEFTFSRMNHFHLEPFVSVARLDGDVIEIWTSTQNPFPLRKELARVFHHPENRVRLHAMPIGGGFGSKNNCRTEPIAIRLAQMTGRPVRWAMTTEEGFLTNTQHAAVVRLRTGIRDGLLVAREADVLLDSGAYSDGSPLVCEKAAYRAAGPYRWEYVDSTSSCVLTNTTPAGAFRGFGGTQVIWAGESQVDMIARRLGEDPFEFRRRNLLELGDPFTAGESAIDSDLKAGLELVRGLLEPIDSTDSRLRGVGVAIGVKDGGGVNKPAQARVKVTTTGHAYLHCGSVEIGQGVLTAMSQVVAEILSLPLSKILYAPIDTDSTPFDQGTNASSSMTVMGKAVEQAATRVRQEVLTFAADALELPVEELDLRDWQVVRGEDRHDLAPLIMRVFGGTGFEFTADGFFKSPNSHHAPLETPCVFWEVGWAAAAVTVDPDTGQVTVDQLVVSGDAGRAINPQLCRGQDEGAAVMGLAQAMFEQLDYDGPWLRNMDALDYRVPLAEDLPARFVSVLQEQGHGPGPFGAKGMGEGAMLPVPPAIANAIHDATGVRVTELPLDPTSVLRAIVAAEV